MAYEVKLGFATGWNLVFAAFQPNGTGRGMANQPLYEVFPTGYYRAEPAIDLVDGDTVLVYENETVTWEDEIVVYLTYDYVFYEGEQVYWEGDWVMDLDGTAGDVVHWTGDVVGSGEFTLGSGDFYTLSENINLIVTELQRVSNVYDETEPAQEVVVIKNL